MEHPARCLPVEPTNEELLRARRTLAQTLQRFGTAERKILPEGGIIAGGGE